MLTENNFTKRSEEAHEKKPAGTSENINIPDTFITFRKSSVEEKEKIRHLQLQKEKLLSLGNDLATVRNKSELTESFSKHVRELSTVADYCLHWISEDERYHYPYLWDSAVLSNPSPGTEQLLKGKFSFDDGIFNVIKRTGKMLIIDVAKENLRDDCPAYLRMLKRKNVTCILGFPVFICKKMTGIFFANYNPVLEPEKNMVAGLCAHLAIAVSRLIALEKVSQQREEIRNFKDLLEKECDSPGKEPENNSPYHEIIGKSPEINKVFQLISQVAGYDSTVLILGETGTGKELVARAIHQNSPRRQNLMVKLNCATLPPQLIESELFGHERGSFTGAMDRRVGKFELANGGTLFLDEIGEMPLELQSKLLRVLQEKEIERIGGKQTIPVDVRIIAATNRELLQQVSAGKFRSDLYYRLNIFPITLPPLRQRKEDIPLLASHFIQKFTKKTGKKITALSPLNLKKLMKYQWPGNIRELEHLLERNVLLVKGSVIEDVYIPEDEHTLQLSSIDESKIKTIEENEREHIMRILKLCKGRIGGLNGAASMLGVPPSTLSSKIKKLGIKRMFNL